MTTAVTEKNESKITIHTLLEEVAALRARVLQLTLEVEALQLNRYTLAPAHIVEDKLQTVLQYKDKLDSDIEQLEVLKAALRQVGYRW